MRRGYRWMLVGNEDVIKPDRMVMRWLQVHGADLTPHAARYCSAGLPSN
ncbi:hypothetical protein ACQP1O_17435 [Nocardia sp. CA-151230]